MNIVEMFLSKEFHVPHTAYPPYSINAIINRPNVFLLPQGVALSYALLPFQNEKILFRFVLRSVCTNFSNGKLGGGSVEKMKVF